MYDDMGTLLLSFSISVLVAVVTLLDKWKGRSDSDRAKKNALSVILLALAILPAYMNMKNGQEANKRAQVEKARADSTRKLADRQAARIDSLTDENNRLAHKTVEKSDSILQNVGDNLMLANKGLLMSNAIAAQTREMNDFMGGTGTYCYLDFPFNGTDRITTARRYVPYRLYAVGRFPLNSVKVTTIDVSWPKRTSNYDIPDTVSRSFLLQGVNRGNVQRPGTPNNPKWCRNWASGILLDTGKVFNVVYYFESDRKAWSESLKMVYLNYAWEFQLEANTESGKMLFRKQSSGFQAASDWLEPLSNHRY